MQIDFDSVVSACEALWQDVLYTNDLVQMEDNDLHRRNLVRSVFALVEGAVFLTKVVAYDATYISLTEEERDKLRQELEKPQPQLRSLIGRIEQMFDILTRDTTLKIDYSHHGWRCLKRAKRIRDRLTHPRTVQELRVSNQSLDDAIHGINWFHESLFAAFDAHYQRERERHNDYGFRQRALERQTPAYKGIPRDQRREISKHLETTCRKLLDDFLSRREEARRQKKVTVGLDESIRTLEAILKSQLAMTREETDTV